MKSDLAMSSSRPTSSMPAGALAPGASSGSWASTFMRSPTPRSATWRPMLPKPTTPSVLPVISTPANFFFSHSPFFMLAVAWGILRARANM